MSKDTPKDSSGDIAKVEKPAPVKPDYGKFDLVPANKLRADPNQPRKKFSEASLKELAESFRYDGVLQPIVVRPADSDGIHEIIMGERRWRAASMLGLESIPIIVREMDDISIFEAQVVENLGHFRIDLDTLERAHALKKLMEAHGDQKEVGFRLGKSQSWVSAALAILDVPEQIMQLSEDKVIRDKTTLVALNKVALESPEAAQELMDLAKQNKGISREVVNAKLHQLKGTEPRQRKDGTAHAPVAKTTEGESSAASAKSDAPPPEANLQTPAVKAMKKRKNVDKVRQVAKLLGLDEMVETEGLLERLMDVYLESQAAS